MLKNFIIQTFHAWGSMKETKLNVCVDKLWHSSNFVLFCIMDKLIGLLMPPCAPILFHIYASIGFEIQVSQQQQNYNVHHRSFTVCIFMFCWYWKKKVIN